MRPARLIPLLLGSALLIPLTWYFVRAGRDGRPAGERSASWRSPWFAATAGGLAPEPRGEGSALRPAGLSMPVAGVDPASLRDGFSETRGGTRSHDALDIPAATGTPVLAVDDGVVRKLFTSVRGGLTVYEFDLEERYCYYYAHLDSYAPSLHEGQLLRRGELVGFVGSTGNARKEAPHLHFAVTRLDADKRWWGGTAIDPYPLLGGGP